MSNKTTNKLNEGSTPLRCLEAIPRLTNEQTMELAACFAEYCGVDPQDKTEWRREMVSAKKFARDLMAIWRKREKRSGSV